MCIKSTAGVVRRLMELWSNGYYNQPASAAISLMTILSFMKRKKKTHAIPTSSDETAWKMNWHCEMWLSYQKAYMQKPTPFNRHVVFYIAILHRKTKTENDAITQTNYRLDDTSMHRFGLSIARCIAVYIFHSCQFLFCGKTRPVSLSMTEEFAQHQTKMRIAT